MFRTRTSAPERFLNVWRVSGGMDADSPGPRVVQAPALMTSKAPSLTSYSSVRPWWTCGGGDTDPGGSVNSIPDELAAAVCRGRGHRIDAAVEHLKDGMNRGLPRSARETRAN